MPFGSTSRLIRMTILEWMIVRSVPILNRFRARADWQHSLDELRHFPAHSWGASLAAFLNTRGFGDFLTNYEAHDAFHTLLEYDTNVIGELRLQAFMIGSRIHLAPELTMTLASRYTNLPCLPDTRLTVYASAGVEQQARTFALRFERAYSFLTTTFAINPAIQLAVLSSQDWPHYTKSPLYGAVLYDYPERTIVTGGEPATFWQPAIELLRTEAPTLLERLYTT